MTNTQQMMINHRDQLERARRMNAWTEQNQIVIRSRIQERELEAASERLAATAHASSQGSIRRSVGWLLILAGRLIAGGSVRTGSPAARPVRPTAA
jgi:hypothetical protein